MADEVPAAFAVAKADVDGATGLAVRGEVDVSVVPDLKRAVDAAIRDSVGVFVLDLCDVEFLDSSGLGVILRSRAMLARDERALAIVCPPGSVPSFVRRGRRRRTAVLYDSHEDVAADLVPTH